MQRTLATTIVVGLLSAGAALVMVGCGGDAPAADEFRGVWKYNQAAASANCSVAGPQNLTLVGNHKEFREGATSDLVEVGCDYKYDIKNRVATIESGQICDLGNGDSESNVVATFTLTSATTMEESTTATDSLLSAASGFGVCTLQISGHLVRISKD